VLQSISLLEELDPVTLLTEAKNTLREKWDWAMPDEMATGYDFEAVRRSYQ